MTWLEEFSIILLYSTRTQFAIFFGALSFFALLFLGHYFSSNFMLQGVFAPIADAIRPIIFQRYESEAWGSLFAFLILAFKCFQKDKKRFFKNL